MFKISVAILYNTLKILQNGLKLNIKDTKNSANRRSSSPFYC